MPVPATHIQLGVNGVEILFRALLQDGDKVLFARHANDRTPLPASQILAGPYGRVSDPIIVNPMPIIGNTPLGRKHLLMADDGAIVLRTPDSEGRAMRDGWYCPVPGHRLYAFVAKELVPPPDTELRHYE